MSFSEFKRMLNSDPASQDAEYQAARESSPEFVQAAAESDQLEQKLRAALSVTAPAGLLDELKAITDQGDQPSAGLFQRYRYAIAATVVLAFSAALFLQQQTPEFESAEAYVAYHYGHDGQDVLQQAIQGGGGDLTAMLASLDLQMSDEVSKQVRLVKYCPTPQGTGIHLVMETNQGLVTVLIMPDMQVLDGERFAFNNVDASFVNLPDSGAAAAIVGQSGQLQADLSRVLHSGLTPRPSGA